MCNLWSCRIHPYCGKFEICIVGTTGGLNNWGSVSADPKFSKSMSLLLSSAWKSIEDRASDEGTRPRSRAYWPNSEATKFGFSRPNDCYLTRADVSQLQVCPLMSKAVLFLWSLLFLVVLSILLLFATDRLQICHLFSSGRVTWSLRFPDAIRVNTNATLIPRRQS